MPLRAIHRGRRPRPGAFTPGARCLSMETLPAATGAWIRARAVTRAPGPGESRPRVTASRPTDSVAGTCGAQGRRAPVAPPLRRDRRDRAVLHPGPGERGAPCSAMCSRHRSPVIRHPGGRPSARRGEVCHIQRPLIGRVRPACHESLCRPGEIWLFTGAHFADPVGRWLAGCEQFHQDVAGPRIGWKSPVDGWEDRP